MSGEIKVRRARRGDIRTIAGIMNSSGWLAPPITEQGAAMRLLQKGYFLSISRTGAGLAGWQVENLVSCIDDFYIYPPRDAARLGKPLLEAVEAAAQELECEVSAVLVPEQGRTPVDAVLAESGYEKREIADLDGIWSGVLNQFAPQGQTHVWLKRLRSDRVTMPV